MKIMVVSNLYPPHHIGGYEIGCRDVVESLRQRGHDLRIVTSRYEVDRAQPQAGVFRELYEDFCPELLTVKLLAPLRQWSNRRCLQRHLSEYRPELVYFWNLAQIGIWPFFVVAERGTPSACYVSDPWLEAPLEIDLWSRSRRLHGSLAHALYRRWASLIGEFLGINENWPPSALPQLHFTSAYIQRGVEKCLTPPAGSVVIHWGVASQFTETDLIARKRPGECLNILYSGQLAAHKGIETAIRGVAQAIRDNPSQVIRFRVAGSGPEGFVNELKYLVGTLGLDRVITFEGRLPRAALIDLYVASDIYVFPSEWEEPFAISPLEAMASGCAVVATATGGSGELFKDGENALVFNAGDYQNLADRLKKLITDPELRRRLAASGASHVRRKHRMSDMVDSIESRLQELARRPMSHDRATTSG